MRSEKTLFYRFLAQTSEAPLALEIAEAKGSYLFDVEGKRYIDFISGISVSNLGHGHAKIVEAVKKQAEKYMHLMVYGEFVEYPQVKLAEALCKLLPSKLDSVYFVNSGAEAIEGAMKLAKRHTGRHEIIAFKNAYHGSSHGALSIMGNEKLKKPFRPLLPGIKFLTFNNFADLEKITEKTAAVIAEVIQAEAGIILPDEGYINSLADRCKKTGALLVVDEIQTGMGRTGKMFGFEHYNIQPDIITLAKALGGGMPLGAFVASKNIMKDLCFPPLGHITTFGGHPVCCAAALEAINILKDEDIIAQVDRKGELIRVLLEKTAYKVNGKGLFLSLDLLNTKRNFSLIGKCLEKGLLTDWFLFSDNKMRIAPPLNVSDEDIKEACGIIRESLGEL